MNRGGRAKIIKIVENKSNDLEIDIPIGFIGSGDKEEILFKFRNLDDKENSILSFTIVYQDVDKKIHKKKIEFKNIYRRSNELIKNYQG